MTGPLPRPLLFGSEIYRDSTYGDWHPLRVPRVSTVMDLSRALGWLPRHLYRTSPRAKPAALRIWHTPAYIAALQAAERDGAVGDAVRHRHHIGTTANPVYPEMFRRPATAAGASLLAGELLAHGGVIHHPGGGTHHAFPDRAGGFCYFNDPVLSILSLRRAGARRVAYVDIDAHHSDGVEHGFAGDPDTLLISVHEERRWPFTGALHDDGGGNCLNLPVPRGFNDSEMAEVRARLILPAVAAFDADAMVIQCGADPVEEDPLSRLALSNNAHWDVVRGLLSLGVSRTIVLGGGGYNPWSVGRLWTGIWAVIAGFEIPDRLPAEAEAVLRNLRWEKPSRLGRTPPQHWFTTLRDPPRPGDVRAELRERLALLAARPAATGRWAA